MRYKNLLQRLVTLLGVASLLLFGMPWRVHATPSFVAVVRTMPGTEAILSVSLAMDAADNLYIGGGEYRLGIYQVDTAGTVTIIPGTEAIVGTALAVDTVGNLYIADSDSSGIRKVDTAGVITTIPGTEEISGVALAIDTASNLYIATSDISGIRKMDAAGVMTTIPGTEGISGVALAVDTASNLYITDSNRTSIHKVDTAGVVTTILNAEWVFGTGLAVDTASNLYITAVNNYGVYRVSDVNDTFTIDENTSLTMPAPGVLGNDFINLNASYSLLLGTSPAHGTVQLNPDGSFTYTPIADYNGSDSFTYQVNSSQDNYIATVNITINPVNSPPVALNLTLYNYQNTTQIVVNKDVVADAIDPDGFPVEVPLFLVSSTTHGTLTSFNSPIMGAFIYTPDTDFVGVDSFTYQGYDGELYSNIATFTLIVLGTNNTPTNTPQPTATNTAEPTATNTPEPTATATPLPTETPTNTPAPTVTSTQTATATNTPEPTATATAVPPTATPTATATPEPTATDTVVPPTVTATNTPEPTATPTATATDTPEPTATPTVTPTVTPTPLAQCAAPVLAAITWLQDYSVITNGNLSTSADVQRKALIGGNLTSSNSATFGAQLNQGSFPATTASLEIAGSVANGNPLNINAGSVAVGPNNTVQYLNPTQRKLNNNRYVNLNQGNSGATVSVVNTVGSKAGTAISALQQGSLALSAIAANNTVAIPSGQPGPLIFQVNAKDSEGLAVFQVNAAAIFNNNKVQQIEIRNNVNATNILINVSGANVTWSDGNKVGSWLTSSNGRAHTLWNFYQATSINLGSRNFMGTLLAPNATVTLSGQFNGALAAQALTAQAALQQPLLAGNLCATITGSASAEADAPATAAHQLFLPLVKR